jgi:hypothetical protein
VTREIRVGLLKDDLCAIVAGPDGVVNPDDANDGELGSTIV